MFNAALSCCISVVACIIHILSSWIFVILLILDNMASRPVETRTKIDREKVSFTMPSTSTYTHCYAYATAVYDVLCADSTIPC